MTAVNIRAGFTGVYPINREAVIQESHLTAAEENIIIRYVKDNSCLAFICWEDKDVLLFSQIPKIADCSGGERLEGGGLALERT